MGKRKPKEKPPLTIWDTNPPAKGAYVLWNNVKGGTFAHTGRLTSVQRDHVRVKPTSPGPTRIPREWVVGWWEKGVRKHALDRLIRP